MNKTEMTIACLERAIEVVKNAKYPTEIRIEVYCDVESIPELNYEIKEYALQEKKWTTDN